ncbi:MAG: DNA/RNA non-specific endonuclease [Candidatus Bruticola sp.]
MGIGSISGSSLYTNTQISEQSISRPEGFQGTGKDVYVHDDDAQLTKEQQFAKAGRLFQSVNDETFQAAGRKKRGKHGGPKGPNGPNTSKGPSEVQTDEVSMFEGRNGYDTKFLGVELPLPGIGSSIQDKVAMRTDKPGECELTYTNYSVVMNKERKQCFYAVCNIDGTTHKNVKRSGSWTLDGRIPREYQLGNEAYADNNIDRGHMVRRLDPCWGKNAELASRDTFSYCNSSLQHSGLNQKEWLQLEDHVLASAKGQKMTVITGPIFSENDPYFDNHGKMKEPAQIPMQFFKTVVWNEGGELKSASFILSQEDIINGDGSLGAKGGFDPDRFEVYQVPQKEVERLTDLHFGNIGDITEQPMRLTAENDYAPKLA